MLILHWCFELRGRAMASSSLGPPTLSPAPSREPSRAPQPCTHQVFLRRASNASAGSRPRRALALALARAPRQVHGPEARKAGWRNGDWWRRLASLDDFEVEDVVDYEIDAPVDDEDEDDMRDYDLDLEPSVGDFLPARQSKAVDSADGDEEATVVDYKINEDEFHKLSLHQCDFFIRKAPDPDNDVYDFSEMYVTPPDTDVYAIPKRKGKMPKKPVRLMKRSYEYISVTEPPVDAPRAPLYKSEKHVMKVFLMKHYRNRRSEDWDFVLDLEEVYVIDTKTKTISRAPVEVHVPGGKKRDRSEDVLIVRDDGNSFRIIHQDERSSPCEVVGALQWERSREQMENYLKGFRDYEVSNWF